MDFQQTLSSKRYAHNYHLQCIDIAIEPETKKHRIMQTIKFCIALFISFLSINAMAQNVTLPIKTVNGVNYYVYTVEPSEGLFAISRKFSVTQAEINNVNPDIHSGLKVGQQILVPINEKNMHFTTTKPQAQPQPQTQPQAQVNIPAVPRQYIEHVVERRQTLFAISKKYNVSQDELILHNPELKDGLKADQVIRIPVRTKQPATRSNPDDDVHVQVQPTPKPVESTVANTQPIATISHIVEPKETLFSISRRYGVEVADLLKINPEAEKVLQAGMTLRIPRQKQRPDSVPRIDSSANTNPLAALGNKRSEAIKIAFLLPFGTEQSKNDPNMERFKEFYQGALIAIYEAKQKGISFEIHTFDTDKTESQMMSVLEKNSAQLRKMDLIVGPAYTNQVAMVSDFARNNRILTMIPFTSRVFDIETNPYLLQFNPGITTEFNVLKFLLNEQYKTHNVIMVEADNINYTDDGRALYEMALAYLKAEKRDYQVVKLSDNLDFSKVVKRSEKNLMIFNTNRLNVVGQHFAQLAQLTNAGNLWVYQQFSWQNNDTRNLKGFYTAPFKDKMNVARLKDYDRLYNRFFDEEKSTTMPRFDLLGYDLISFACFILSNNNNADIAEKLRQLTLFEGIQSQMKFERMRTQSGFVNQYLFYIDK